MPNNELFREILFMHYYFTKISSRNIVRVFSRWCSMHFSTKKNSPNVSFSSKTAIQGDFFCKDSKILSDENFFVHPEFFPKTFSMTSPPRFFFQMFLHLFRVFFGHLFRNCSTKFSRDSSGSYARGFTNSSSRYSSRNCLGFIKTFPQGFFQIFPKVLSTISVEITSESVPLHFFRKLSKKILY